MRNLFIFLLVVMAACKKANVQGPDNRRFSGVVLDYSTGQPVANAVVKIIRLPGDLSFPGIDPEMVKNLETDLFRNIRVDSLVSNAEGKYELVLDAAQPPFRRYLIAAYKPGYTHPYIRPAVRAMDSASFTDTTYLDKNSYLRIVVNNDPPAAAGDSLGLRTFYLDTVMPHAYLRPGKGDSVSFIGAVSQAVLIDTVSARAFPKARVVWTIIKNGNVFTRDSLVVDLLPLGTTEVHVNY